MRVLRGYLIFISKKASFYTDSVGMVYPIVSTVVLYKNEHICATALYYYSTSNVTENRLSFRQRVSDAPHVNYDHGDYAGLNEVFGCCYDYEAAVQDIGDVC